MSRSPSSKYERALTEFNRICLQLGLTQTEVVIVAAQFTGMAVATCPLRQAHDAQLEVAARAMRNAYETKMVGGAAPDIFDRQ
jgi:hypothetical protein